MSMTSRIALRPGDRVLVTRLNYLGDVVLSLPLVDAIRAAAPGVEIDYLSREPGAALLCGDPRFARVMAWTDGVGGAVARVVELRRRRYRAVVDLYSNPRSAWISWLSGAPVRVGGDRRGRRRLYTHPVSTPAGRAVSDVFMAYGVPLGIDAPAGKPSLALSERELESARGLLARHGAGPTGGGRIGVHPGGKWPVKRWPSAKFVELVGRLARPGGPVVLLTGPDEADATARVAERVGDAVRVLPLLGIRETAAVIANLDALVACDGGVMHVAVAVGTPTVGIFGSSQPEVWFPYEGTGPYRAASVAVPCRPCHRHECPLGHTRCLNDLGADEVAALVDRVLEARFRGGVA